MKKLAILTPGFYEQAVGGAEFQTYLIAEYAKQQGWDVSYIFIATKKDTDFANNLNLNLHPVYIKTNRFFRKFGKYKPIFALVKTWKLLKQIKPDIIYSRTGGPQSGLAAFYSKKNKNSKSVWQVASDKDVIFKNSLKPFDWLYFKLSDYGIKYSTRVLSQTKFQQQMLLKKFQRESILFRNLHQLPKEEPTKNKDFFQVIWVANLKQVKRPMLFIELVKSLPYNDKFKFIMVGKNQGVKSYESIIGSVPNLLYLGEKSMEEVNSLIASSYILVNTSEYEGFSNTFIQSWMRNTIVCTLGVDPDNLLSESKMGYCCNSINQMKDIILDLYSNNKLRQDIAERAKTFAIKEFSLNKKAHDIKKYILEF